MADRNEDALLAAIKALEQAVLPAVSPTDPLAGEQLKLTIGYLKLLRSRLGHAEDRARFELAHYRAMAQSLHDEARAEGGEVAERFDAALVLAAQALRSAEVRAAAAALSAAVSGLVRTAADAEPERRRRIEHAVAQQSRRWVDAQRAWFAPLGFDLRPAQVLALEDALAPARAQA